MNTVPLTYGQVTRESIYVALAKQLQTVMGLSTFYRARVNLASLNANLSPVGVLMQATSKPHYKEPMPTRYVDTCIFVCAVTQQSTDPSYVAATQLNNMRDLLDLALAPEMPDRSHCTLGGLIDYVRPTQDVYGETLEGYTWTHFGTTLEFRYTPINEV
jgi:hypothetical protein